MTLQEFCQKYNYKEATMKTSFNRTAESMRKKGLILSRTGTWKDGDYQVIEDKNFIPSKKEVQLSNRLVGQRFGHLMVLKDTGKRKKRAVVWDCICDCGQHKELTSSPLVSGHAKTCGKEECPYHHYYKDLTGQKFGKLTVLKPTTMKDGTHMYWLCQCECGQQKEVASNHLKRGDVCSCGCIKTSIGEINIKKILEKNGISYKEQVVFKDLKNINPLRFDFGIYQNEKLIRLVEFDGIQHFEEQNYFTHSLAETKNNDIIKNEYAKKNDIPLVRIPYWERDKITLEMILGDEYLIERNS